MKDEVCSEKHKHKNACHFSIRYVRKTLTINYILLCRIDNSASCVDTIDTVVPATAGHRWFGAKVAGRGRWPAVAGGPS